MGLGFVFTILMDLLILPLGIISSFIFTLFDVEKYDLSNFDPRRKSIILLHGSGYNHSEWIIARLFLTQYNVFSFNYAGLFSNKNEDSIEDYAYLVSHKISQIHKITQCHNFVIIGHSMGGLIASYYATYIAPINHIDVDQIITISTPWNGAPGATYLKGIRYKQMLSNSDFLAKLKIRCQNQNIYSLGSWYDWAVPYQSCVLDAKLSYVYSYYGHYSLMTSPKIWRLISNTLV